MASPTGRLVIPAVARFVQPGTVAPRASRAKLDVMFVARVRSLALLSALTCACGRVGVVGHGSSRGSLVASSVYNEAGIPQTTPTSTSRLLHAVGPWTFMLAPDDSAEGAFMAAFAAERLGARRVSIFFVNDEYGAGLRDGVRAELQQRRVAVLDEVGFGTESDYAALVGASLRRGRPDVIIIAGRAADSIYVVAFWLPDAPDSLSRAFVERFRRIAGRVPQSSDAMSHSFRPDRTPRLVMARLERGAAVRMESR